MEPQWPYSDEPSDPDYWCPSEKPPSCLEAQAVSTHWIYLAWDDTYSTCEGTYRIERRRPGGAWESRGKTALLRALDEVTAPGSTWEYRVGARWVGGYSPVVSATTFTHEHWRFVTPVLSQVSQFRALHFAGTQVGYACGEERLLLKTRDGGESWSQPSNEGLATDYLLSVAFRDEMNGVVGSIDGLWMTADGARSWVRVLEIPWAYACAYVTPRCIVAAGRQDVQRTSDGGAHWEPAAIDRRESFVAIAFADSARGWLGGHAGGLYATEDGGASWTRVPIAERTITGIVDLAFSAEGTLLAGTYQGLLRLAGGAETWPEFPASMPRQIVAFADAQTAFAGSEFGCFRSRDAGVSWQTVSFPVFAISDLEFATPAVGVAAGRLHDTWQPAFLRTTDGGGE